MNIYLLITAIVLVILAIVGVVIAIVMLSGDDTESTSADIIGQAQDEMQGAYQQFYQ